MEHFPTKNYDYSSRIKALEDLSSCVKNIIWDNW